MSAADDMQEFLQDPVAFFLAISYAVYDLAVSSTDEEWERHAARLVNDGMNLSEKDKLVLSGILIAMEVIRESASVQR